MIEETAPVEGQRNYPLVASYAVVLGMLICLSIVVIGFLQWLVPGWYAGGMVIVCALAAIEAAASHRLIQQLHTAQHQLLFYRITEWILILLALKIFTELSLGPANFWNNIQLWPLNFPLNIFNTSMLLTILPVAVIWGVSNLFDNDLMLMGTFESYLTEEGVKTTTVRNLILRRFLNVGMFLVALAGIPPQSVIPGPLPVTSNAAPAVVMYFVLGIILLSLTRYSYLSTLWRQAKVKIPIQIPRRWFAYSAGIIVVLALLIFTLPANYGMGLMDTLSAIFGIIYRIAAFIYSFIFLLINYLSQLLLRPSQRLLPEPIVPPAPPAQSPLPAGTPAGYWKLLESILFWGALAVLVIVALRQYILFNKDLADELKHFRPFRWLALFWKRVTASVKKANKSVGIFVQSSLKRLRSSRRTPTDLTDWDYINPRRLNTRQKILFYYLALLRRADQAGLPRRQGQTPYEYARTLTSTLEEGKDGVEALTGSFVEARYSRHDIPREEARRVESLWETIRRLLRNFRKSKQQKDKL